MKHLRVFWIIVGLWRDQCDGSWHWSWPKFAFRSWVGRPCTTRWLYDWWFDLGIISIAIAAEEDSPFVGSIESARLHDHALSSEEIAALAAEEK